MQLATQICSKKNLSLVSFETLREKNCFSDLTNSKLLIFGQGHLNTRDSLLGLKYLGLRFWTSISNEGPDPMKYTQCASNVDQTFLEDFKNASHWMIPNNMNSLKKRCVAFEMSTNMSGFQQYNCIFAKMPYICEVSVLCFFSKKDK